MKNTLDKAYGNVPKDISSTGLWEWIQPLRGLKYYYLKFIRFVR